MGIPTAQAKLLASQFLNTQGESKDVLVPRKTISELFLIAGELVEDAQRNLKRNNSNASGNGSESIILTDPRQTATTVSVSIEMNAYLRFVNKGVKGTRSGNSTANYKFKTEYANKKMALSLLKGIRGGRNRTRNTDATKSKSKKEIKDARIGALNGKAAAYGAAVNIKKFGIKPTGFMDKAIDMTERKVIDRLGKAFEIDVFNIL